MIRGLRECKTQAQEREYIQKELGNIRNSISVNKFISVSPINKSTE